MTRREQEALASAASAYYQYRRAYHGIVEILSGGRRHSQACRVGGVGVGMIASIAGDPCWCGVAVTGDHAFVARVVADEKPAVEPAAKELLRRTTEEES